MSPRQNNPRGRLYGSTSIMNQKTLATAGWDNIVQDQNGEVTVSSTLSGMPIGETISRGHS
eukprot:12935330-Prorocentrum_lima.AAC.1